MTPKIRRRLWRFSLIAPVVLFALWADCMLTGFTLGLFHHPRERWGEPAMAVMRDADSVEVIRLTAPRESDREGSTKPFYGMVATGTPITPSDAWVARLRDAMDNSWNYDWYLHSRCIPTPGVCVRFRHGSDVVDLLLCFECGLASLAPTGKLSGHIQDQWNDFRVKRSPFAALVKELFPNDAAIQAIGSK